MKDFKEAERSLKLCEKEIDALADQFFKKEEVIHSEVACLRLELEAVKLYLARSDPSFSEVYQNISQRIKGNAAKDPSLRQ